MSSIVRAPRQRLRDTNYVSLSAVLGAGVTTVTAGSGNNGANIFEFVPTSNNYVANYPPGAMVTASTALVTILNNAIIAASNAYAGTTGGGATSAGVSALVLRDMGKTIRAQVGGLSGLNLSVPAGSAPTSANSVGTAYFRQVQLMYPTAIQSYIGGSNLAVNNVFGELMNVSPDGFTPYLTFYLPVVVDNIGVNGLAGVQVPNIQTHSVLSGQM